MTKPFVGSYVEFLGFLRNYRDAGSDRLDLLRQDIISAAKKYSEESKDPLDTKDYHNLAAKIATLSSDNLATLMAF